MLIYYMQGVVETFHGGANCICSPVAGGNPCRAPQSEHCAPRPEAGERAFQNEGRELGRDADRLRPVQHTQLRERAAEVMRWDLSVHGAGDLQDYGADG